MSYNPDPQASPEPPWNVTILTQRDVAFQIPINFVTYAGVSITAACFGNGVYQHDPANRCISNLLAIGFRKLVVDIYWDQTQSVWSLCPVRLPNGQDQPSASTPTPVAATETEIPFSADDAGATPREVYNLRRQGRSDSERNTMVGTNTRSDTATNTETGYTTAITASHATSTPSSGSGVEYSSTDPTSSTIATDMPSTTQEAPFTLGNYTCTDDMNIELLLGIISTYIQATDDTLSALVKYFVFNLHAIAATESPDDPAPAPAPGNLPSEDTLLGSILSNALSGDLYTPKNLESARSNLRTSWDQHGGYANISRVDTEYLTENDNTSPDGWPSESYIEFVNEKRAMVGFGSVDEQMAGYDFTADLNVIFYNPGISSSIDLNTTSNGTVVSGCIFNPNDTSISTANSSWAQFNYDSPVDPNQLHAPYYNQSFPMVNNITACGISSILNVTLSNASADVNWAPYREFVYSSIWSWAVGEPLTVGRDAIGGNVTRRRGEVDARDVDDDSQLRCAALSIAANGRWQVEDCQNHYHGACRSNSNPYQWFVTDDAGIYSAIGDDCPDGSSYAVPRTAMENSYLLAASYRSRAQRNDFIWLNLNDFDIESCWVVGVNMTCPYNETPGDGDRQIVVPVIAAIIILVVAVLTLLAKCRVNSRNTSRKRRRKHEGWDYDGVPS